MSDNDRADWRAAYGVQADGPRPTDATKYHDPSKGSGARPATTGGSNMGATSLAAHLDGAGVDVNSAGNAIAMVEDDSIPSLDELNMAESQRACSDAQGTIESGIKLLSSAAGSIDDALASLRAADSNEGGANVSDLIGRADSVSSDLSTLRAGAATLLGDLRGIAAQVKALGDKVDLAIKASDALRTDCVDLVATMEDLERDIASASEQMRNAA